MMGLIPQIARAGIIGFAHAAEPTGTLMLACKGRKHADHDRRGRISTTTGLDGDLAPSN